MRYPVWLAWKELCGRKPSLLLNAALVALTVGLCVFAGLASRSRAQAVKGRAYHLGPTLTVFPRNDAGGSGSQSRPTSVIDYGTVAEIEERFGSMVRRASGRFVFKAHSGAFGIIVAGFDPARIVTPFPALETLGKNEAAIGVEAAKKTRAAAGARIKIGVRDFLIKEILPPSGTADDTYVFITMPDAWEAAGRGKAVSEIGVYARAGVSSKELGDALRKHYPHLVVARPSAENAASAAMDSSLEKHAALLYFITGIAAFLCLMLSALLNARDRTIEFASLYAMGASRAAVFSVVALRSAITSVAGSCVGSALGAAAVLFFDPGQATVVVSSAGMYAAAAGTALIAALVAALPAAVAGGYRNHALVLQESQP